MIIRYSPIRGISPSRGTKITSPSTLWPRRHHPATDRRDRCRFLSLFGAFWEGSISDQHRQKRLKAVAPNCRDTRNSGHIAAHEKCTFLSSNRRPHKAANRLDRRTNFGLASRSQSDPQARVLPGPHRGRQAVPAMTDLAIAPINQPQSGERLLHSTRLEGSFISAGIPGFAEGCRARKLCVLHTIYGVLRISLMHLCHFCDNFGYEHLAVD
jgi:hypothetical protein